MVTNANFPTGLRKPRSSAASLTFSANSSRRVRDLTKRASTQMRQLRMLLPLYQRTERILMPAGLKRLHGTSSIPVAQQEAGTLLYTLNHELVQLMNKLTDTLAALQAHVDEATEGGN